MLGPREGMLMFAASTLFNTLMQLQAKILGAHHIPVFQIVMARSVFMVVCCAFIYFKGPPFNALGVRRGLLVIRGFLGFCSVTSIFAAVRLLPLGDATALSFLAPAFSAAASPLILNERPSKWAIASLPMCLFGVLLLAQPSFLRFGSGTPLNPLGVVVGCSQAVFSAGAKMCVRKLRTTECDHTIVLYMAIISTLGSSLLCAGMPGQQPRAPATGTHWVLLLLGVGVAGYCNQRFMTAGLRYAPGMVPAISLSYLSLVWALGLGALVFNERPNAMELLGSGIIISTTLVLSLMEVREEAARNKQRAADGGAFNGKAALEGPPGALAPLPSKPRDGQDTDLESRPLLAAVQPSFLELQPARVSLEPSQAVGVHVMMDDEGVETHAADILQRAHSSGGVQGPAVRVNHTGGSGASHSPRFMSAPGMHPEQWPTAPPAAALSPLGPASRIGGSMRGAGNREMLRGQEGYLPLLTSHGSHST